MRKNKREDSNEPGDRGMFYDSKKCYICGKLVWGSSPKNHRSASKDCYFKMKAHQEECQKQGKQLDLSIQGIEENHTESIERITLTGEKKS